MSALANGGRGRLDSRPNDSKGCGTIMRNGTIALHQLPLEKLIDCAVNQALITHGHDEGFLPCALQTVF